MIFMSSDHNCPEGFRRYFPLQNKNRVNNKFDFYISGDESVIYKKNNHSSSAFSSLISDKDSFNRFEKILDGSVFEEILQNHISKGFDLETDGSYKSEFIHGYRLDLLDTYQFEAPMATEINEQCKILQSNLKALSLKGTLTGDWALHNLVFSLKYNKIMNIDLEGFLTYSPLPDWADFDVINEWIEGIITDLNNRIE